MQLPSGMQQCSSTICSREGGHAEMRSSDVVDNPPRTIHAPVGTATLQTAPFTLATKRHAPPFSSSVYEWRDPSPGWDALGARHGA